MARIIRANGSIEELAEVTVEALQKAVGGYFETTLASDNKILVVNEEGKIEGLPFNPRATCLLRYPGSDMIVGDAVLCEREELD